MSYPRPVFNLTQIANLKNGNSVAKNSQVNGGYDNSSLDENSVINGGYNNKNTAAQTCVNGGHDNNSSGNNSVINGGHHNTTEGANSTIEGGDNNTVTGSGSGIYSSHFCTLDQDNSAVIACDNLYVEALDPAYKNANTSYTQHMCVVGSKVFMIDIPTTDPVVAGQLWSNSGVLTISSGI